MAWQRPGQAPQYAGPGDTVVFAAGDAHRFWNAGQGLLRCTGYVEPADNVEYFLAELFASTRRRRNGRPDPFDAAYLASRYRSEFGIVEIPALVQRVLFPVVVRLGAALGRYARYADAPEPVRG